MTERDMMNGEAEERGIDLHVHSVKSDGTFTTAELVEYAVKKRLRVMALTDHDTVDGLSEIRQEAAKIKDAPEIVNGIELSTDLDGKDIHIVGLFIDYEDEDFKRYLKGFIESRDERNERMCEGLKKGLGMDISLDKLKKSFPGAVITRAHYARFMFDKGYVGSINEAFDRYIGDGKPYYIARDKVPPEKGVEVIKNAKGIPVLAHPLLYGFSTERLEKLIEALKEAGLMGIETRYTTHTAGETRYVQSLAEKYGLLESGGSDFHGKNKADVDLATGHGNLFIPYEIYEKLRAAL